MTEKTRIKCARCLKKYATKKNGEMRAHPCSEAGPLDIAADAGASPLELMAVAVAVSDPAPTVEPMDDDTQDFRDPVSPTRAATDGETYQGAKGPWFGAMYAGTCDGCFDRIHEGDRIRADGKGGYECEGCGEDDLSNLAPETQTYQQQASAAAKRHQALLTLASDGPSGDMASDAFAQEQDEAEEFLAVAAAHVKLGAGECIPLPTPDEFMDPATPEVKLNVSGQPEPRRDWQGRYIVKDHDLGDFRWQKNDKPKGLTRVTTFVKRATDNKAINDWQKRNVLMGAVLRPDVVRRAHGLTHENGKDQLDRIVGELDTAAGGKVSSEEGTFLHEETEFIDAGLKRPEDCPPAYQADLKRYVEALAKHGLEPVPGLIERTVMVREFGGVVGMFDRIFYHRASGQYVIGDLKTGKTLKYGMDEIQAQLWFYAHGVNQSGLYDWNSDTWEEPHTLDNVNVRLDVREDVGVIIHMPVQGPEAGAVYVRKADLVKGKAYAELCADVRDWEKSKVQDWEGLASPSWEDRFRAVGGKQDATELWLAAKADGLAGMELDRLVKMAQHRLRQLGF